VGLGGSQRAHRWHKLAVLATPGAAEIMELPRLDLPLIQAGAIPVYRERLCRVTVASLSTVDRLFYTHLPLSPAVPARPQWRSARGMA
jgi:hypothetical protein